jgi:hypothetical protein
MSYYSVTVLTPSPFLAPDRARVADLIGHWAFQLDEHKFSMGGQPFDFEFPDLEEDERRVSLMGWSPLGALRLTTYTGAKVSHILLGALACKLAQTYEGWIALDGHLESVTSAPAVLTFEGVEGRIRTSYGVDVISPSVMTYWLGYEDFRLV